MGLKQTIVIKNEFSVKTATGGSRGATPGRYVYRYAAREGASEPMTPVRKTAISDYIEKYSARRDASESIPSKTLKDEPEVLRRRSSNKGGFAFSNKNISLSDAELRRESARIQSAFDRGKTVMKTVVSFDTDFLIANGVLPEGFKMTKKGDARGHLDQMRLRRAIQEGLTAMGKQQ